MSLRPKKIDYVDSVTALKTKCARRRIFFIFYFYINKNQNAQNNRHDLMMKRSSSFTYMEHKKHCLHTVVYKNTNGQREQYEYVLS